MGALIDRIHRELTDEDVVKIAATYHAWRGDKDAGTYKDVPGFCKAAKLDDIRRHGHMLTPGRYVGNEEIGDDGEPFEERMQQLVSDLLGQTAKARALDEEITRNLKELGYGD
jgi:type I restriction enzyme M protein